MSDLSQQLIEQVKEAYQHQSPLFIQGNNSKAFLGRSVTSNQTDSPRASTLSTAAHTGIISYQPVELVMTARAGTTLAELQAALDEHQQMLAFESPFFNGQATIAGTLAANLSGPARPWAGSIRDAVLGTRLINGQGEHLRFGGQVMKNVAGYDLSRMQAGALGTLGVITEVSFKVLPKPESTAYLQVEIPAQQAITLMNQLAGQPKPITGACWYQGKLQIRLSGAASAVDNTVTLWSQRHGLSINDQGAEFWHQLQHYQLPFFTDDASLWRFSVKSTAPLETSLLPSEALSSSLSASNSLSSKDLSSRAGGSEEPGSEKINNPVDPDEHLLIDWCGNQRWLKTPSLSSTDQRHIQPQLQSTLQAQLQQQAETAGGTVTLWRGGDRSLEVNHEPNPVLKRLQQNVKQAMDPTGIFNPGRLYSWM